MVMMPEQESRYVILAVDDAPENLDTVKSILVPEFAVKAAISGNIALKIAARQPPDLILLDIMMPEMDGYEVCRQLKSDEQTAAIPVIFLTAELDPASRARGFELGAAAYVSKPIDPAALRQRIREHLG
jgi:putative two-component system response regulator